MRDENIKMTIDIIERGEYRGRPAVSILILYPSYTNYMITERPWYQAGVMLARLVDFVDRRPCVIECDECEEIAICAIRRAFQKHISFQCRECAMENWKFCRDQIKILWSYSEIVQSFGGETDDIDDKIEKAVSRLLYAKGIDRQKSLENRAFSLVQKGSV